MNKGLVQIYTGPCHLTPYAPLGLALRASGHDLQSLIACFFPGEHIQAAAKAAALLDPNLVYDKSILQGCRMGQEPSPERVRLTFERIRDRVLNGSFDIVVLENLLYWVDRDVLDEGEVIQLLEDRPATMELVITGPALPDSLLEKADLITEMTFSTSTKKDPQERPDGRDTQVVTGNGKGKTTYCLGQALIHACRAVPSFILQVVKSPRAYGEIMAIERIPDLKIRTMGEGFLDKAPGALEKRHVDAARKAWETWLRELYSMKYGLLVLDEINIATFYGLIRWERVKEMMFLKPGNLRLLLSGRNAHTEVVQAATTVIEMKEVKHPYQQGIRAREGIEF